MVLSAGIVDCGKRMMEQSNNSHHCSTAVSDVSTSGNQGRAILISIEEQASPRPWSWRKLWRYAGPGLLMCIAYVDPGNLESDLQTGANTGYTLLWLLGLTTVMGYVVQMQAARLGVATSKNLAELCRSHYPRAASIILWLMAEVAIIGSDIQEVIGSAIALSILSKGALPLWVAAVVSAVSSFILLLVERAGVRFLEAVFAFFITGMVVAFGCLFWVAKVPFPEVAHGFLVPELQREALPTAVALFGSLIMPHNIYLHSALVQSRGLQGCCAHVKKDALTYFGIESGLSLGAALLINTFVVCVFSSGFHVKGADPPDIGLRNAGEFLGSQYGAVMVVVWGLGLLAAGQSSTMTGTYTGQFVMSGFLDLQVSPLARVIITRTVALAPTLAVTLTMDAHSTSLDKLNQPTYALRHSQRILVSRYLPYFISQAMMAMGPFALIPVLTFTGSAALMGPLATRGALLAACWAVAVVVILVNMTAVAQVTGDWASEEMTENPWVAPTVLTLGCVVYFGFLLFLMACSPDGCLPQFWSRARRKHPTGSGAHTQPLLGDSGSGAEGDSYLVSQHPLFIPAADSSHVVSHGVAQQGKGTGCGDNRGYDPPAAVVHMVPAAPDNPNTRHTPSTAAGTH